ALKRHDIAPDAFGFDIGRLRKGGAGEQGGGQHDAGLLTNRHRILHIDKVVEDVSNLLRHSSERSPGARSGAVVSSPAAYFSGPERRSTRSTADATTIQGRPPSRRWRSARTGVAADRPRHGRRRRCQTRMATDAARTRSAWSAPGAPGKGRSREI